jgi:hypothetical protein
LQLAIIYLLSQHAVNESIRIPAPQRLYRNEGPSKHQGPILPNDGSLNGIPLFFKEEPLEYSTISCVGDNFQSDAHTPLPGIVPVTFNTCAGIWNDTTWSWFHLLANGNGLTLFLGIVSLPVPSIPTFPFCSAVSRSKQWGESPADRLKWFPQVLPKELISRYYQLPDDCVWIPYHIFAAFNPGHLVLDDWLSIYTLLTMFGLEESSKPLLMR